MMGVNTSMLAIGRQSGVTLIELVVTVVVAVILAAAAVPSLRGYVQNTRIATVTNDVVALVHDARSEAAIRGVPVGICPSDDGVECSGTWSDGWLSFLDLNNDGTRHYVQIKTKDIKDGEMCDPAADECFLRHYGAAPSGALFSNTGGHGSFVFLPTGFLNGGTETFELCIDGASSGRQITILASGHLAVTALDCGP